MGSRFTDEQFDNKLEELLKLETPETLLAIPGIYEILSEHFNNEVLADLAADVQDAADARAEMARDAEECDA
jgi:hypothetical protein